MPIFQSEPGRAGVGPGRTGARRGDARGAASAPHGPRSTRRGARDREARRAVELYASTVRDLARQNVDVVLEAYDLGRFPLSDLLDPAAALPGGRGGVYGRAVTCVPGAGGRPPRPGRDSVTDHRRGRPLAAAPRWAASCLVGVGVAVGYSSPARRAGRRPWLRPSGTRRAATDTARQSMGSQPTPSAPADAVVTLTPEMVARAGIKTSRGGGRDDHRLPPDAWCRAAERLQGSGGDVTRLGSRDAGAR